MMQVHAKPSRRILLVVVLSAFLFLLNLWIVRELLTTEYLDQMGSIEGTHVALGRWAAEHLSDLTWFPLWYGGIPFQNAYSPLHPLIVALVAKLGGITAPLAYHAVTAIFYSLGPVTLFWLALRLSRSLAYSFAAGLFYSLLSPSAFLISIVRHDLGSPWYARRLQALVQYGEGPHIAAMTLLPVALLLLIAAIEKRRPAWWVLAALGLASVAMTNWLGTAGLAMAIFAWLLATHDRLWWRPWAIASATGIYAYAMACSWIPPSTILGVRSQEKHLSGPLSLGWWHYAVLLLAVAILLAWVLRHLYVSEEFRFSVLFLLPAAFLTLSEEWFGLSLAPQAKRYHLEMEMALALAIVFSAKLLFDHMSPRVPKVAGITLLALCIYSTARYRNFARHLTRPVDIRKTIEYREAGWFDRNMNPHRVFAHGSVGFFLNVFTNTPQYSGGFDQGVINPLWSHVHYLTLTGDEAVDKHAEAAVLWLKAFGVDAISVSGPRSREAFKPYRNPDKFDGNLPELWRDGDDVIYRVPRRSMSLAWVIRPGDLPSRQPEGGLDLDPVRPYVAALENPDYPLADFTWRNNHSAVIAARMHKDEILSVQISYHPGWHATVNGEQRRIYKDRLGQLAIEPQCEGPCEVEISYDGGREMAIARVVSWTALLGGLAWIIVDVRRRRN